MRLRRKLFVLLGGLCVITVGALFGVFALAQNGQAVIDECADYPEKRVWVGSQAWWSDTRVPFPGAHIHLETCFPLLQTIKTDGTSAPDIEFDIKGVLHGDPGRVSFLRIQVWDDPKSPVYQKSLDWRCTGTCIQDFHVELDLDKLATSGRKEFRMTFNIPDTSSGPNGGNRQFETTRWHMTIDNGKPRDDYSNTDRSGAAGWYTGSGYANIRVRGSAIQTIVDGPLSGTFTFQARGQKDNLIVAVDPSGHGTIPGTVIFNGPGNNDWRTITLDTTRFADGVHTLSFRTDDQLSNGIASGVFQIKFVVANGIAPPTTSTTETTPTETETTPTETVPTDTTPIPACDQACLDEIAALETERAALLERLVIIQARLEELYALRDGGA